MGLDKKCEHLCINVNAHQKISTMEDTLENQEYKNELANQYQPAFVISHNGMMATGME